MSGALSISVQQSYDAVVGGLLLPPKDSSQIVSQGFFAVDTSGEDAERIAAEQLLHASGKVLGQGGDRYYTYWPRSAVQSLLENLKGSSIYIEEPLLLAILTFDQYFLQRVLNNPAKYYLHSNIKSVLKKVGHYALLFAMLSNNPEILMLIANLYKKHGLLKDALEIEQFIILKKSFLLQNPETYIALVKLYKDVDLLPKTLEMPLILEAMESKQALQLKRVINLYRSEGLLRARLKWNSYAILKAAFNSNDEEILKIIIEAYLSTKIFKELYGGTRAAMMSRSLTANRFDRVLMQLYDSNRQKKFRYYARKELLKRAYVFRSQVNISVFVSAYAQDKKAPQLIEQDYRYLVYYAVDSEDVSLLEYLANNQPNNTVLRSVLIYNGYELLDKAITKKNPDVLHKIIQLYKEQELFPQALLPPRGMSSGHYNMLMHAIQTKDERIVFLIVRCYENYGLMQNVCNVNPTFAFLEAIKTEQLGLVKFIFGCYLQYATDGIDDPDAAKMKIISMGGLTLFNQVLHVKNRRLFNFMIRLYKSKELLITYLQENNYHCLELATNLSETRLFGRVIKLYQDNGLLQDALKALARGLPAFVQEYAMKTKILKTLLKLLKENELLQSVLLEQDEGVTYKILAAALYSNNIDGFYIIVAQYREHGLLEQALEMQDEDGDCILLSSAFAECSAAMVINVLLLYMNEKVITSITDLSAKFQKYIHSTIAEFVEKTCESDKVEELAVALLSCQKLSELLTAVRAIPKRRLAELIYFCVLSRNQQYWQLAKDVCSLEYVNANEENVPKEKILVPEAVERYFNRSFYRALKTWLAAESLQNIHACLDMLQLEVLIAGFTVLSPESLQSAFRVNAGKSSEVLAHKDHSTWIAIIESAPRDLCSAIIEAIKFISVYNQKRTLPHYTAEELPDYITHTNLGLLVLHFTGIVASITVASSREKLVALHPECQDLLALIYATERPDLWAATLQRLQPLIEMQSKLVSRRTSNGVIKK